MLSMQRPADRIAGGQSPQDFLRLGDLPSQQGKGTRRFVIEYIINEIKQKGASALQLQVYRQNKARNFYEKLGFTLLDTEPNRTSEHPLMFINLGKL